MMVEGLLFDLYGTLTVRTRNSTPGPGTGRVIIGLVDGLGIDASSLDANTVEDEIWQFVMTSSQGEGTPFEARLSGFLNTRLRCDLSTDNLRELADSVCSEWERSFQVDPDANDVLQQLGRSRPLGLVSNFDHPPHVHRRLSETGLARHFTTIVVSGDVGTQKPDPEILRIASGHINATPNRCAYVGDSIVDYRAADAAGMAFIWVRRPPIQGFTASPGVDPYLETDAELESMAADGRISRIDSLKALLQVVPHEARHRRDFP